MKVTVEELKTNSTLCKRA